MSGVRTVKYLFIILMLFLLNQCTSLALKENRKYGITPTELQYKIDAEKNWLLFDVRTNDEYYSGHLPGAKFFPANDIFLNTGRIPAGKDVILYCSDGQRSLLVVKHLRAHGYLRTRRLDGGLKNWPGKIEQ